MKKYFKYRILKLWSLMLVGTMAVSCDTLLDVEPVNSIDTDTSINSPASLESALVGAYDQLQDGGLYGTDIFMAADLLVSRGNTTSGGYLDWRGTFESYRQISAKQMLPTNAEANLMWASAYSLINRANIVLANINVGAPEDTARVRGEALFLRAIAYFEMVKFYGKQYTTATAATDLGVPLVLTPAPTSADDIVNLPNIPRNTVAQVYAQILSDINQAIDKLPDVNTTGGVPKSARAGKVTALAYLARIQLQRQDYAAAGAAADEAISLAEDNGFGLLDDRASVFNSGSTNEQIFDLQQNDVDNAGSANNGLATFYSPDRRAEVRVSFAFFPYDDEDDERVSAWFNSSFRYCLKYNDPFNNYSLLRLSELYLIRAECSLEEGTDFGGITPDEDVNTVRSVAGVADLTGVTIQDVLDERFRELACEGQEIWTIKRRNILIDDYDIDYPNPGNDRRLLFPIPQREINLNSLLVQN